MVETSSDRVTFRILPNISDGAPVRRQPTGLTRCLFIQKRSTTDLRPICQMGIRLEMLQIWGREDCKCMELVAADWSTRKWLSFDQTIGNFIYGDLGIPLVVIQLRVTRLKKKTGGIGSMILVP